MYRNSKKVVCLQTLYKSFLLKKWFTREYIASLTTKKQTYIFLLTFYRALENQIPTVGIQDI